MDLVITKGVAELRIGGPIDRAWVDGLLEHTARLHDEPGLRVVKIIAGGRHFCPGGDLHFMHASADRETDVRALAGRFHEGILALTSLDAPVVARVHGPAAGGGMSFALCADLAIAAESAWFTMAYTAAGLSPDGGGSWLLPRIVGQRRAADLILTNRRVSAREAEALGIVTRAVPDAQLDSAVDELVAQLAGGATAAYGAAKRLLAAAPHATFAAHLDAERDQIAALAASPAGSEGIAAFAEKRAPRFP